jgi:ring-1,2-phenylacetyl-CoA epoxidase subunit PaaE
MTSLMLKFFQRKKTNAPTLIKETVEHKPGHFHTLTVSNINRETADCVSVAFEVPDNLVEEFKFLPGQYLTLRTTIHGEDVRRSYSICSSPLDGELRVAIKEVEGGVFSTYANRSLKEGEEMRVMTPQGNFILQPKAENKNTYVAFAAGSGITPMMSIIKAGLEIEPDSNFILFYGNRSTSSIIFRDELDDLKSTHLNRLEVHHILSREDQGSDLLLGRIDGDKVKSCSGNFFDPAEVAGYYLCGPGSMIEAATETLQGLGVEKDKIHFELFNATGHADKVDHSKPVVSGTKITSTVSVVLDGDETHFEMTSTGKTILDAALDAGADVPFACKGAVCCTCRAKVLEGSAVMEMNYALMDDEVADGYILTCQSHPTSERVVVSYDE